MADESLAQMQGIYYIKTTSNAALGFVVMSLCYLCK